MGGPGSDARFKGFPVGLCINLAPADFAGCATEKAEDTKSAKVSASSGLVVSGPQWTEEDRGVDTEGTAGCPGLMLAREPGRSWTRVPQVS